MDSGSSAIACTAIIMAGIAAMKYLGDKRKLNGNGSNIFKTIHKIVSEKLKDVVYKDNNREIQEQAVFALSQLPKDEGIPKLIKIGKSHPSLKVRKKAIFWLGQTEDSRAVDALVEIVQKK